MAFGSLVQYKGASIAMIVFDVNNKESFKSCAKWYQDVKDASPNHSIPGEDSPRFLASNLSYRSDTRSRHSGGQ